MRLVGLKLKNFRQYKEACVEFPIGLIGIIGPNGSGKSTLLEAVAWALYGTPALRGTKETVKWLGAQGRTSVEVELDFELGSYGYQIRRSLGDAQLFRSGALLAKGVDAVTEKVTQLLGMDYKLFFASYFTNQKELAFLKDLQPKDKAATIARMLGYDRIEKAITLADEHRRNLKNRMEGLKQGLPNIEELEEKRKNLQAQREEVFSEVKKLEEQVEEAKRQWEQARSEVRDWEAKWKEVEPLKNKKLMWERDRENKVQEGERLRKEIDDLFNLARKYENIKAFIEEFEQLQKEYNDLQEQRGIARERKEKEKQLADLSRRREGIKVRLSQTIPDLRQLENSSSQLRKALQEVEEQMRKTNDRWQQDKARVQEKMQQLDQQRNQALQKKKEVQESGVDGQCPTCKRPLGSVYEEVIHHFDEEIRQIVTQLQALQRKQKELEKEPETLCVLSRRKEELSHQLQDLQRRQGEAETLLQNRQKEEQEYQELEAEIFQCQRELSDLPKVPPLEILERRIQEIKQRGNEIKPYRDQALKIQNSPEDLKKKKQQEAEVVQELRRLETQIMEVEAKIREIGYSEDQHQQAKDREEKAKGNWVRAQENLSKARERLVSLSGELKEIERQIEETRQKRQELKEMGVEHRLHEVLSQGLRDFREKLNQQIGPELAERVGSLLDDLTQGRYNEVYIDERYQFFLKEDGEVKPVISGGEEDILNLALRLAISQMIAERSGQVLNLLILDEIFGSLDNDRRARVVSVLQALRNRFEQIIVISHIEAIHDMVDQCLWVEYDPGERCSRLRMGDWEETLGLAGVEVS